MISFIFSGPGGDRIPEAGLLGDATRSLIK
jgi:hypothetical protein